MALLRLTALARLVVVCLLALRVRDLVLPALAGMGRTKTWWSVLPIVRVCGGTGVPTMLIAFLEGLSPRLRADVRVWGQLGSGWLILGGASALSCVTCPVLAVFESAGVAAGLVFGLRFAAVGAQAEGQAVCSQ